MFLRDQDITLEQQHELASYYGIVSVVDPPSCIMYAELGPSKIETRTKKTLNMSQLLAVEGDCLFPSSNCHF